MNHTKPNPSPENRLQLRIDVVLTALFLAVIFFMGAMTLLTDFHGIRVAATDQSKLASYVDDVDACSAWDYFAARIRSVDNYLASNVYGSTQLGYLNSSFQYALGKRMVNTGASQMVTLNTGHLFDLQNYVSMESAVQNIQNMRATAGDIPFLFVYEHLLPRADARGLRCAGSLRRNRSGAGGAHVAYGHCHAGQSGRAHIDRTPPGGLSDVHRPALGHPGLDDHCAAHL